MKRVASCIVLVVACGKGSSQPALSIDQVNILDVHPPSSAPVLDTTQSGDSLDQLTDVFPPKWKVGDHWRVVTSTDDGSRATVQMKNPPLILREVTFDMRVAHVPSTPGDLYRVDASGRAPDEELRYQLFFRPTPFSFVRVYALDRDGNPPSALELQVTIPMNDERDVAPSTHPGGPMIQAFPAMPPDARLGAFTFTLVSPRSFTHERRQDVSRDGDRLRFSISDGGEVETIIVWEKGKPWWSSLDYGSLGPVSRIDAAAGPVETRAKGRLISP